MAQTLFADPAVAAAGILRARLPALVLDAALSGEAVRVVATTAQAGVLDAAQAVLALPILTAPLAAAVLEADLPTGAGVIIGTSSDALLVSAERTLAAGDHVVIAATAWLAVVLNTDRAHAAVAVLTTGRTAEVVYTALPRTAVAVVTAVAAGAQPVNAELTVLAALVIAATRYARVVGADLSHGAALVGAAALDAALADADQTRRAALGVLETLHTPTAAFVTDALGTGSVGATGRRTLVVNAGVTKTIIDAVRVGRALTTRTAVRAALRTDRSRWRAVGVRAILWRITARREVATAPLDASVANTDLTALAVSVAKAIQTLALSADLPLIAVGVARAGRQPGVHTIAAVRHPRIERHARSAGWADRRGRLNAPKRHRNSQNANDSNHRHALFHSLLVHLNLDDWWELSLEVTT